MYIMLRELPNANNIYFTAFFVKRKNIFKTDLAMGFILAFFAIPPWLHAFFHCPFLKITLSFSHIYLLLFLQLLSSYFFHQVDSHFRTVRD